MTRLVLREDDRSFPIQNASSWACEANEHVVDVQRNTSSSPQIGPHDAPHRLLVAVRMTRRLVILSAKLSQLRACNFQNDVMGAPVSLLWVSQTLMYVTMSASLRL
ncbi:hypothetical protein PsorP6_000321 [Peronosclerospora sorghi]|uniref:Uncharacterized protein n=1 Tax=Peronosclerospora sorghi TaxID=230839 RepID=A0ACC0WRH9_9STRA|nr:hypothetical protein PsorP6_000321 [Peronosclerospora sorghi]